MADQNPSGPSDTPAPLGEIEHGPSKFEQFMEKNLKVLLALGLVIILAVAAYVILSQLNQAKNEEAGHALLAAQDAEALRSVEADFADTPSAGSAKMLLADKLWEEGQEDEAISTLEALISDYPEHPLVPNARFSLATMWHKQGQRDQAVSAFESLLNDSSATFLHPLTLIQLGDLAKAAGNDDQAKAYYERKIEEFGDFADQNLATTRLNLVGVIAPERVEPALPAPPTPPTPPAAPAVETSTEPIAEEVIESAENTVEEVLETVENVISEEAAVASEDISEGADSESASSETESE